MLDLNAQIAQWVKNAREFANLTQEELGDVLNRTKQSICNIENNRSAPSYAQLLTIVKITKYPKPFPGMSEGADLLEAGYIEIPCYDIQSSAGKGSSPPVYYEPLVNKIQVLEDWAVSRFGKNPEKKIRVITNEGDSMAPTFKNGDLLFVDTSRNDYRGEGVYVILHNGMLRTKRLQIRGDGALVISSDNHQFYPAEVVRPNDGDELIICGKVLGSLEYKLA